MEESSIALTHYNQRARRNMPGLLCSHSHGIFRGGIVLMQGRCSQGHRSIPHRRQAAGDPGQEDSMLLTRDQADFEMMNPNIRLIVRNGHPDVPL